MPNAERLWLIEIASFSVSPDAPVFDADLYPEVCLRGLAGFIPGLRAYIEGESERPLIDGGYYTQTPENRPLIGPGGVRGYFINGAFAGFGLMAAEAAGESERAGAAADVGLGCDRGHREVGAEEAPAAEIAPDITSEITRETT